jgi:hypothetical protein
MNPYRTQLSLRMWHPEADLSEFCRKAGLTPKVFWTKGDPRMTPKGRMLGGVRDSSYCLVNFGPASDIDLIEKIEAALAALSPHRADIERLVSTGGRITFSVAWFLEADTGKAIEWHTLGRMHELRIGFDFYLYVPERGEPDDAQEAPR